MGLNSTPNICHTKYKLVQKFNFAGVDYWAYETYLLDYIIWTSLVLFM